MGLATIFLLTLLSTIFLKRSSNSLRYNSLEVNKRTTLINKVQQVTNSFREIKLSHSYRYYLEDYSAEDYRLRHLQATNKYNETRPKHIIEAIVLSSIAIAAISLSGDEKLLATIFPSIGAFLFAIQRALPQVQQLLRSYSALSGCLGSVKEVARMLKMDFTSKFTLIADSRTDDFTIDSHNLLKIELQNVSLSFGKKTILSGVNETFVSGEFIAIVGDSGSGKSTLLDLVSGLLEPSSGCVLSTVAILLLICMKKKSGSGVLHMYHRVNLF